uniref:MHC class II antigen n=1 Tax=Kareius bicoloratus TaxID=143345 RepID=K9USS0_KARBC|nr:MHC class II antigen [Kareius bicoloratus]AFY98545.1 MHC class II antigen [Kareius bicoloratus]
MKMNVLVLCFVLSVSAEGLHKDLQVIGCSDSDGEEAYNLDGEEMWFADFINNRGVEPQPSFIDHMSYREGAYQTAVANQQACKTNLGVVRQALKDFKMENDRPSSPMIYTEDKVELGGKNTLICHVTGFYPPPVHVYWTKNEENVTEGTSLNVPYPNQDRSFRQTARLEFTAQQGDVYSCTVSHPALDQPLTKIWDVDVPQPGVGPSVFCGVGLSVGLLGVAAGTFFLIKGNECS